MRIPLCFVLVVLLMGCVSIRSSVKSGEVPEFGRILVVTRLYDPPRGYEQRYLNVFPKEYEVCAVGVTPLSFNPDSLVNAELTYCKSDVMLTIRLDQEGVVTYSNVGGVAQNTSTPSRYLAEMKSTATGQPFWKAIISGSVGGVVPPRTVVKQLIKDGILKGKIPLPM